VSKYSIEVVDVRGTSPQMESSHQFLKRLLESRRAKWEHQELKRLRDQGKQPSGDEWKKRYKEPAVLDEIPTASVPETWAWASAETICESVRDGTHDTPEYVLEGVPLVTSKNLRSGRIDFEDTKLISREDHIEISKRSGVENGDVLFAMIGTIGNPLVVKTDREFSIKNVGLFKKNDVFLDSKFLKFWLDSPTLQKWLEPRLKGTTQKFAPLGLLRSLAVPVAPLDQQKRIVAEIEKQFSRLDEAVANLKRVKANLKRYKAAVLKAAVEGKLTEEWRKAHPDVEPASELLKRILAERRAKWKGKIRYKEPEMPSLSDLPDLPASWTFARIEQLLPPEKEAMKTGPFGSLLKKHEHRTEGVPVFGIENIEVMHFVPGSKIHVTAEKAKELNQYRVESGDILISRSGTVGEVCVVPEDIGAAIFSTNVVKISLVQNGMNPQFFTFLFNGSPFVLNQVADLCKGSTRNFLNQDILKTLVFVLPPVEEQEEIVREFDLHFSLVKESEKEIDNNLRRAQRLKQSILTRAFSGQLMARHNLPNAKQAAV
jgi:type I restriction enzyme S subunit